MSPMTAAARNGSEYQMRRSVRTCQRIRIDSANDGGTSSVAIVSALAPAAWRSQRPRCGSCSLNARKAKITTGKAKMMNGERQP